MSEYKKEFGDEICQWAANDDKFLALMKELKNNPQFLKSEPKDVCTNDKNQFQDMSLQSIEYGEQKHDVASVISYWQADCLMLTLFFLLFVSYIYHRIFKRNNAAPITNASPVTETLDLQNPDFVSPATEIKTNTSTNTYIYHNEAVLSPQKTDQLSDSNKIDFGKQGEKIVLDYEIASLIKAGKKELADKVVDVSDRADLGYDILSFLLDGRNKYIEVKTARSEKSKFYISLNEMDFLKKNDQQAFVYRVIISKQSYPEIIKLTYQQIVNDHNIMGDNFLVYWQV